MCIEEIIKEYRKSICPRCKNYNNKSSEECNITINIKQEANCINYKCSRFFKNVKENNGKFIKERESKLIVTAKQSKSIMKLI